MNANNQEEKAIKVMNNGNESKQDTREPVTSHMYPTVSTK